MKTDETSELASTVLASQMASMPEVSEMASPVGVKSFGAVAAQYRSFGQKDADDMEPAGSYRAPRAIFSE